MKVLDKLIGHECDVTKVYSTPNCSNKADIIFYQCSVCGHGQIKNILDNKKYYQNYELIHNVNNTGVSGAYTDTLLKFYEKKFAELNAYIKSNETILDIGCGPGVLLKRAMKYFKSGIGVEPSCIQTNYAENKLHIKIINSFFDEKINIKDESIDAFICTQVFEHLENVREVARVAYNKLKMNGVGYIEVPNGQKIISQNRYYDIFPEHLNYYSILSLTTLLVKSGFEIIKIEESFDENYISAFVKKTRQFEGFTKEISNNKRSMDKILQKYNNYAIWGAGTKSRSFISLLDIPPKYIFDNNPLIQGGYLSGSSVKIERPDITKLAACEAVVIFAISYKTEIEKELREKYNYKGEVISMDNITMFDKKWGEN